MKLSSDTLKDTPLARLAELHRVDGSAPSSSTQQLPGQVFSFSEVRIKAAEEMACEDRVGVDAPKARVEAFEKVRHNRVEPKLSTVVVLRW